MDCDIVAWWWSAASSSSSSSWCIEWSCCTAACRPWWICTCISCCQWRRHRNARHHVWKISRWTHSNWYAIYCLTFSCSCHAHKLPSCFRHSLLLGRSLGTVDLIKFVSNVRPSVRVYVYVRTYVHPSTKSFYDFSEIWQVGRDRWVMHIGRQYDLIQGQGHEPFKLGNPAISTAVFAIYNGSW